MAGKEWLRVRAQWFYAVVPPAGSVAYYYFLNNLGQVKTCMMYSQSQARITIGTSTEESFLRGTKINLSASEVYLDVDRFFKLGYDSDGILPTADVSQRGKMIRIEAADESGEADRLCICVKKTDDTYGWFDLISATFVA